MLDTISQQGLNTISQQGLKIGRSCLLEYEEDESWKLRSDQGDLPPIDGGQAVTPMSKNSWVFSSPFQETRIVKLLLGQNGAVKKWRTKVIPVLHQGTQAGNIQNHCKMVTDSIRTGRNWLCTLWSKLYQRSTILSCSMRWNYHRGYPQSS